MNLEEYFSQLQKRAKQQKDQADRAKEGATGRADTSQIQRFLDEGKRDFN
jgi:hypothetical protein